MLSKIKEYMGMDFDKSSESTLRVGIIPYNTLLDDFNHVEVVWRNVNEEIPKMDVCFLDNTANKEILTEIKENADILISLGSCITFEPNLVLPGLSISDEFLTNVMNALIDDDLEYFKPLIEMTKNNDFREKTILITLLNDLCIGCSGCAFICPCKAISMKTTRPVLDTTKCVHCGSCFVICPKSWILSEEVEAWF